MALGWAPARTFERGLGETIEWYRENTGWIDHVLTGEYAACYERMYG